MFGFDNSVLNMHAHKLLLWPTVQFPSPTYGWEIQTNVSEKPKLGETMLCEICGYSLKNALKKLNYQSIFISSLAATELPCNTWAHSLTLKLKPRPGDVGLKGSDKALSAFRYTILCPTSFMKGNQSYYRGSNITDMPHS